MGTVGDQSSGGDRSLVDDLGAEDPTIVRREGVSFLATTTTPVTSTPAVERVLEWIYVWRTWLVFGLAGVITASVSGAYLLGSESNTRIQTRRAAAPSELVQATVAGATTAPVGSTTAPPPVGSATTTSSENEMAGPSSVQATTTRPAPRSTRGATSRQTSRSVTTTTALVPTSSTEAGVGSSTTENETPTTVPAPEQTSSTDLERATSTTGPTSTTTDVSTTTVGNPSVPVPTRVEAESGSLHGTAAVRSDHKGFSGTGFVGDIYMRGSGVTLLVKSDVAGLTPFTVRYSAGKESGPSTARMLTVFVNDERTIRADMAVTASWSDWDVVVGKVPLKVGVNTITIKWAALDTGWVNIDYIEIN